MKWKSICNHLKKKIFFWRKISIMGVYNVKYTLMSNCNFPPTCDLIHMYFQYPTLPVHINVKAKFQFIHRDTLYIYIYPGNTNLHLKNGKHWRNKLQFNTMPPTYKKVFVKGFWSFRKYVYTLRHETVLYGQIHENKILIHSDVQN